MKTRHHILTALLFAASPLLAQQVAQPDLAATGTAAPATTGTTPAGLTPAAVESGTAAPISDEIVEMSVFNVNGNTDEGYAAVNTTSGSRVNTPLRDVASTIDPFTKDFLDDIGATTLDEMLTYASNVETEYEDATNGFNNNDTRFAGTGNDRFRIRGMKASTLVDGFETSIPIDLYNMDRAELASGANSILYGIGAQGGVVMFTTSRANAQRNSLKLRNVFGTWYNVRSPWSFERATMDYNVVLIPRKMGFRLNALYLWNDGWQYRNYDHDKRISPALMFKPWKNTTINITYENGTKAKASSRITNPVDGVMAWYEPDKADRQVMQGFGSAYAVPGTTQLLPNMGNPAYVYVNNNDTMYDLRGAYQSTAAPGVGFMPRSISPLNYSTVGPGGVRNMQFQDWSVVIEQNIGKLNLELKYTHNENNICGTSPGAANTTNPANFVGTNAIRATMKGDPNGYISPADWVGAGGVIVNPFAGDLYMESQWFQTINNQKNDGVMLTAEYTLDLKKYGRHRLIGFISRAQNETYVNRQDEILVDDNQQAIWIQNDPDNAYNALVRRNYLTEGNYKTYYDGAYYGPVSGINIGDKTYHSAWVTENAIENHVKRSINSYMLTLQSYWFNNKLSTIFGARIDDVSAKMENPGIISDPYDPRILNKTGVLNEMVLDGTWSNPKHFNPFTVSAGAVWHASDRLSFTANFSTNRGLTYFDGRTVLPDGDIPPLPKGRTFDYGVRYDFFGDSKLVVSLTRFDTQQMGDATITPAGLGNASNAALGSTNLYNIFDALYFLYPTSNNGNQTQWGQMPTTGWVEAIGPDGNQIISGPNAGPGRVGNPVGWQYAVIPPNQRYPYGTPPQYNAAMVDVATTGYEFTLAGKPSKNIDVRFQFSYSDRNRDHIFQEILDYYNANIPVWMALADPAKNGGHEYYVITNAAGTQTMKLTDYIWNQLYGAGGVRQGIAGNLINQTGNMGARPWKTNLSIRYTFPKDGWLKGMAVRGGFRYQSAVYIPDPNRIAPDIATMPSQDQMTFAFDPNKYYDAGTMIKGNSNTFFDATLSYKYKGLFGGRVTMTMQLNVNNIFNTNSNGAVGRYESTATSTGVVRTVSRMYPPTPRVIRLDVTFAF